MAGADPFAIMKAMGHTDIKTRMVYVSLGKSHIREEVERLNGIKVPPPPTIKGKILDLDFARRASLRIAPNP
jgi:hypothetical protein